MKRRREHHQVEGAPGGIPRFKARDFGGDAFFPGDGGHAGVGLNREHVGNTHQRNRTPHVAVTASAVIVFAVVSVMQIFTDAQRTFGDAGTLAAFGFLLVYFMISIAAPVYLRRRGEITRKDIAVLVLALACLLVPTVGSFYPVPPVPVWPDPVNSSTRVVRWWVQVAA